MFQELNKKNSQTVSTILVSVGRCSKNICILGQIGLLTMIKQGLVQKISILCAYAVELNLTCAFIIKIKNIRTNYIDSSVNLKSNKLS